MPEELETLNPVCPLCGEAIEQSDPTEEGTYGTVHKHCQDFGNAEGGDYQDTH